MAYEFEDLIWRSLNRDVKENQRNSTVLGPWKRLRYDRCIRNAMLNNLFIPEFVFRSSTLLYVYNQVDIDTSKRVLCLNPDLSVRYPTEPFGVSDSLWLMSVLNLRRLEPREK